MTTSDREDTPRKAESKVREMLGFLLWLLSLPFRLALWILDSLR